MPLDAIPAVLTFIAAAASSLGATEALRAFVRRGNAVRVDLTLDAQELDAATHILREELSQARSGGGGAGASTTKESTPAELEALAIMEVYGKELLAEADRIAKRASAERPSKKHVRQAADRLGVLRDRAGVSADLALAFGSILIGAAVSYQVNLWTGGRGHQGCRSLDGFGTGRRRWSGRSCGHHQMAKVLNGAPTAFGQEPARGGMTQVRGWGGDPRRSRLPGAESIVRARSRWGLFASLRRQRRTHSIAARVR